MKSKILCIVGTDTGVGKTIIAAALARAFTGMGIKTGAYKPFACDPARLPDGTKFATDADLLARAADMPGSRAATGQLFSAPLSPLAAARAEGRWVNPRREVDTIRRMSSDFEILIVEGCGGWEVPLTERQTTADFFTAIGAPVVIVGRSGLGTLNHSILTCKAIQVRGLSVIGLLLNQTARPEASRQDVSEKSNPEILRKFLRLPVWGVVDHKPGLAEKTGDKIAVDCLPDLPEIARQIKRRLYS